MNRRGASTLVIVVVLLSIVLLIQVFQRTFTSRVTDQAFRNVHGRTAYDLALTAVEEARIVIERRLADPARPEFAAIRAAAPAATAKIPVEVALTDLHHTRELIGTEHHDAYKLVALTASLSPRLAISGADPVEHEGVLAITATVQSTADSGIVRKVGRTWLTKLVHVAPAGPLQQVNVLIRRPNDVLRGRQDAHQIVRKFMEENLPGLIADLTRTLANIQQQAAASTDAQQKQALEQIRATYAPLVEGADGGRVGRVLNPLKPRWTALAPLPAAGGEFALVNKDDQLGVAELDLQGDFDELMQRYLPLYQQVDALGKQVEQNRSGDAAAQAMHRRYADETGQIAELMGKISERYIRFREKLTLVPANDAAFAPLSAAHALIDPTLKMPNFPDLPAWDKRVCFIAEERLAGNANDALTRLMARLDREDGGVQGVIYVSNPTTPLTVSGTLKGRWTLVVAGNLVIDNVRRANPAQDLFTIVQTASPSVSLSLAGTVDATVVATGQRLSIAAGTQVLGGLFLDDVGATARIDPPLDGPEEIKRDPARGTPEADRRRHALVSPWTRSASVERNP